ncbi:MAG: hypothetical protein BWY06_02853 [Candidatus Latescibacteria bacterium ADurb.Bin168]|nr:MAG: hypothetical protein BWY06_02853 [Candidatus Latescibacteria bacterium ADurb.Bin168]
MIIVPVANGGRERMPPLLSIGGMLQRQKILPILISDERISIGICMLKMRTLLNMETKQHYRH